MRTRASVRRTSSSRSISFNTSSRTRWNPAYAPVSTSGSVNSNPPAAAHYHCSPALRQEITDRHRPSRQGRFCFGHVVALIGCWLVRFVGAVDAHNALVQYVDVPHHQGTSGEVVGPFFRHLLLGSLTVIVLAADFRGEDRSAVQELPASQGTRVEGGVRAERAAMRQVHRKSDVVGESIVASRAPLVITEADVDLTACSTGNSAGQRHKHYLPVYQLRLAGLLDPVQIFDRRSRAWSHEHSPDLSTRRYYIDPADRTGVLLVRLCHQRNDRLSLRSLPT